MNYLNIQKLLKNVFKKLHFMFTEDEYIGIVVLFTKTVCLNSMKTKMLLHELSIPYIDICLDNETEVIDELEKFISNSIETPHIFFNNKYIKSYKELVELTKNEEEFEKILEDLKMNNTSKIISNIPIVDKKIKEQKIQHDENQNHNEDLKKNYKNLIPTEYDKLVSMMRKANLIKDNRVSLTKTYRNSFKGEDFISWVVKTKKIKRSEALELGQQLVEQHFNQQTFNDGDLNFDPEHYYQIIDENDTGPLNCLKPPIGDYTRNIGEFNELLRQLIIPIYDTIFDHSRKKIHIDRLEDNEDFKHYILLMREAVNLDIDNSTIEERIAFFINCYNMQLIHITFKYGIPQTIWHKRSYMYSIYYQIGEHLYSLQSILNGILRGNKKGYNMLWKPFGKNDKRKPYIIPDGEPLIHLAINTYTMSTPPTYAYSTKNVRNELIETAQNLMENDEFLRIDCKKQIIHLSYIFKIYNNDFGPSIEAILEWIIDIMKPGPKRDGLLKLYYLGQYNILYLPENYSINVIREEIN